MLTRYKLKLYYYIFKLIYNPNNLYDINFKILNLTYAKLTTNSIRPKSYLNIISRFHHNNI